MKWTWHVANKGEERTAYKVLIQNPEGKKQLESPRHRLEDNIKMDKIS
jgi:hypothetical protein